MFSSIILNSFAFKICEKVTGRPEVPKQQGELQVADVFCFLLFSPSLLIKQVLPKTNFFFPFLKPWADNGSTKQYSCQLFHGQE